MTALFILLAIAAYAIIYLTAPEGYQDETGFHFGRVSVDLLSKSRTSPTSTARAAEDGRPTP